MSRGLAMDIDQFRRYESFLAQHFNGKFRIAETAKRGITLKQLKLVVSFVEQNHALEDWIWFDTRKWTEDEVKDLRLQMTASHCHWNSL
eukprot:2600761-Amphidinium_carterae.1